jgi:CBS domain-containing protein
VLEEERVVGILSEKDVLRAVADPETDFRRLTVAMGMSSPVHSLSPEDTVLTASRLMQSRHIKRVPILENDRLVGIVTQTDITRGLVTLSPLKSIADIMSRNIATMPVDATIAEAAREMTSKGISCVVATHRGEPAGIVTEKDLIRRVAALQKDPAQTRVADVMSFPIIAIPATYSILSAGKKMDSMHLHRLIVMQNKRVCGIVTQTDIMTTIRRELERLEGEHSEWTMGLATLVQNTLDDLQKLQEVLRSLGI